MLKYKGSGCYNNLNCGSSFIIPVELVKQIQLEALVNAGLKDLRYHLKMKVHPHVVIPKPKVVSFPMKRKVYEALFPTARKFDPQARTDKPLSYMTSGKLYEIELTTEQIELLIGPEWYYSYGGADVAVHVGKIIIRLIERKLVEYQTTLNMDCPEVLMDSVTRTSHYFCRVEFSYRKLTRWDRKFDGVKGVRPDTGAWKLQAKKLRDINYKKVRLARVLKKVNKIT